MHQSRECSRMEARSSSCDYNRTANYVSYPIATYALIVKVKLTIPTEEHKKFRNDLCSYVTVSNEYNDVIRYPSTFGILDGKFVIDRKK